MAAIHYIGHGRLESSPENFSILHVASHELGHVAEFRREAFQNGEDILDIRVRIHFEMKENGKLVATSGETEASFVQKSSDDLLENNPLYKPYKDNRFGMALPEREEEEDKNQEEKENSQEKAEELRLLSRKDYLEGKLKQLLSEIQTLSQKKSLESEEFNPTSEEFRIKELEREKRRLEEELRLVQLEEETRKNFEFLAKAALEYSQESFQISNQNQANLLLNTEV